VTGAWIAAFGLLSVLTLINSAMLVATIRQIGVLHQRLAPSGGGDLGGAAIGDRLPRLALVDVDLSEPLALTRPFIVMAFVSPGCTLCAEIIPGVQSAAKADRHADAQYVFVTDASLNAAQAYRREHGLNLPMLRHDDVMADLKVPASPFLLVTRTEGQHHLRVLSAGVVNTTEQVDDVIALGRANQAAFETTLDTPLERGRVDVLTAPASVPQNSGPSTREE